MDTKASRPLYVFIHSFKRFLFSFISGGGVNVLELVLQLIFGLHLIVELLLQLMNLFLQLSVEEGGEEEGEEDEETEEVEAGIIKCPISIYSF